MLRVASILVSVKASYPVVRYYEAADIPVTVLLHKSLLALLWNHCEVLMT